MALLAILAAWTPRAAAQGNLEIQVYGAETVPAGSTMVELHSPAPPTGSSSRWSLVAAS